MPAPVRQVGTGLTGRVPGPRGNRERRRRRGGGEEVLHGGSSRKGRKGQ